jgi:cytochrome bd-type quinol oxidase subunit 2
MVLYWLDIYYQSLIFGASFRARFLEIYRLKRNLSVYIAGFYGASHTGSILHFLYIGFLIGLVVLGVFVTDTLKKLMSNFDDEARNNLIILFSAFSLALGGIITIYVRCDRSRTQRVREISNLIQMYIPRSISRVSESARENTINISSVADDKTFEIRETVSSEC